MHTRCTAEWYNNHIYRHSTLFPMYRGKRQSSVHLLKNTYFLEPRYRRAEDSETYKRDPVTHKVDAGDQDDESQWQPDTSSTKKNGNLFCNHFDLALTRNTIDGINYYNMTVREFTYCKLIFPLIFYLLL